MKVSKGFLDKKITEFGNVTMHFDGKANAWDNYDFIDIFDANDLRQVEKTIMIMSDDENFNTNLLFANSLKSISGE